MTQRLQARLGAKLNQIIAQHAEKRLRENFLSAPSNGGRVSGFWAESANVRNGLQTFGQPGAHIDAVVVQGQRRLRTSALLLDLLVRDAKHPPDGYRLDTLEQAQEDAFWAGEVAQALIAERPLSAIPRLEFIAELMIRSDTTRPAGLIRSGKLLDPESLGDFGELFLGFLPHIDRSVAATGRIEHSGRHVGSGIFVPFPGAADGHAVLTARHVIEVLRVQNDLPAGTVINFNGEIGARGGSRHRLTHVLKLGRSEAPSHDVAVIAIGAPVDSAAIPEPAKLDRDETALTPPTCLAIVGYPGRPDAAALKDPIWAKLFEGLWHVKRLSPATALAPEPPGGLVHHDATTTSGSSGGPILSIGSGRVAGIHLGASSGEANMGAGMQAIGVAVGL